MIFAQHVHRLFRLGGLGERGEAAQVAEHHRDLAAVAGEQRVMAVVGGDQLRHLRREEALQLADALDLAELLLDPLLQRAVPVPELLGLLGELRRLLLHGVMGGGEFAALVVDLRKQPRVAHRQHRLVGEGAHQADQVLAEMRRRRGAAPPARRARPADPSAAPPAPHESRRRPRRRATDGRRSQSDRPSRSARRLAAACVRMLAPSSIDEVRALGPRSIALRPWASTSLNRCVAAS